MISFGLTEKILAILLAISLVFGGWNWWRKNVYHTALNTVAAQKITAAREAEKKLADMLSSQANQLQEKQNARADALQRQLDEIGSLPPSERVVYKLRDRWLPTSCPATAEPGAPAATIGGLHPEDEQFLVREAARADDIVDERNACVDAYNAVRQAVIKASK